MSAAARVQTSDNCLVLSIGKLIRSSTEAVPVERILQATLWLVLVLAMLFAFPQRAQHLYKSLKAPSYISFNHEGL